MNPRITPAERADGIGTMDPVPRVVAHECPTCRGSGGIYYGPEREFHGNVFRDGEDCPTCDGDGVIYEPVDDHPLTQAFAERRGGIKIVPAAVVVPAVEVET